MTFQALPAEHFASQSALDKHFQAQCKPHNPSVYNSGNPLYVSGYQGRSQQAFQNLPEPQWVLSPQMQPTTPQSMQAVVGSQYCAPMPVTFFLKHKRFSHGSDPVSTHIILDDQGSLAYTVDRPRASLKTKRVLRDAEGNPICTMRLQVVLHTFRVTYICCENNTRVVLATMVSCYSWQVEVHSSHSLIA